MTKKKVSGLFIYPIKALGGIPLTRAKVKMRGLEFDRRWMLVDSDGVFLSQRSNPKMALMRPTIHEDTLIITAPDRGMAPLPIPLANSNSTTELQVRIWNDHCTATKVGKEQDEWFSQALGQNCQLVFMASQFTRPIKQQYRQNNEHVSFADGYPYLIIGEESLADLNHRLEHSVPMNRFRPNIVFSGGQAYEEDHWTAFQIGGTAFRGIKPCVRCQVPTINQDTAVAGKEPIKTLSTYRRQNNGVIFGLNACWQPKEEEAWIKVGDTVEWS